MKDYIIRKIKSKYNDKYKYEYYDKRNNPVDPKVVKFCLQGLYIPPAHDDVQINLNKDSKILAIGYDSKDRPQYIYNKKFTQKQSKNKYKHMIKFGESYKKILRQINKDLFTEGENKNKQIATILKIVIDCSFRIGNEKYTQENNSYGVTTLESRHIKVNGQTVSIDFIGKKGVRNQCKIKNKKLSKNLKTKKRTIGKDHRLFSYRKKNRYYESKSSDVNRYLKQFGNFTTKNFRTWGANLEFIIQLLKHEIPDTITGKKRNVNESLQKVADKLHNTKAVCKSNYIDPYLIQTYLNDTKRFNATFKNAFTKEEITDKYIELLKLNH